MASKGSNLRGNKGTTGKRQFAQRRSPRKESEAQEEERTYDNPLVSFGGIWDKAGKTAYMVGYVSSDRDKQALADALEEVLGEDNKSIKVLIFPNERKKGPGSPDRIMYLDVVEKDG